MASERSLAGRRVVVTRAPGQASVLAERLRAAGAEPVEVPVIMIAEPGDGGAALRAAAASLRAGAYDWLVCSSANAAARLVPLLGEPPSTGGARVAAVGPGTANALTGAGIVLDLVPDRFVAEALLAAFPAPPPGGRVLLPRAAVARPVLPDGLRAAGWRVDVVEAYRTVPRVPPPGLLAAARTADAVTFTSASTVTSYLAAAGREAVPPVVACIGPVTAAAAQDAGLDVATVAEVHTAEGLVAALAAALGSVAP